MKQQKGMRAVAFILAFCLVFHSGTIYATEDEVTTKPEAIAETQADSATLSQNDSTSNTSVQADLQGQTQSDTSAVTEAQDQMQSDTLTVTETQEQIQSDISAGKEIQDQTAESDPTAVDTDAETPDAADSDSPQPRTPAAGETLPEGTNGSDENVSGTPGTGTDGTAAEETTGEAAETGETALGQETTTGETLSMTEPLSENGETESETESESESDGIAMMMGLDEIDLMSLDAGSVANLEDGTSFETLQQAIEAVPENGTITLLSNITESVTISGSKNFTLNLRNHTWKPSAENFVCSITGGAVTFRNGTISGGSLEGSALVLDSCTFKGENITVCDTTNTVGYGAVHIKNSHVTLNDSVVKNNKSTCYGAGIALESGSTFVGDNLTVSGNKTEDGSNSERLGGGIYVKDTTLPGSAVTLTDSHITGNTAYKGGGIYTGGKATLEISGTEINDNSVTGSNSALGAGLCIDSATIHGDGLEVYDNISSGNGGGVCLSNASGNLENSNVYKNTAIKGAGIYENDLSFTGDLSFNFNQVNISENKGSGQGAAFYGFGVYSYTGGKIVQNDGGGGESIVHVTTMHDGNKFDSVNFSENTNADYTINVIKGNTSFENCMITGNTASDVGGIRHCDYEGVSALKLSLSNTVIKGNTATGNDSKSAGGLSFYDVSSSIIDPQNFAIYNNKTNSSNQANDICVGLLHTFTLICAKDMVEAGKSFEDYEWKVCKDGSEEFYSDSICLEKTYLKPVAITAVRVTPRPVASIGEEKFLTLEEAVSKVDSPDDVIVLIAGEEEGDPLGKTLTSSEISIKEPVTIDFNGRSIICEGGDRLFHVENGGSLTLKGEGTIRGEVCSEGTLTLQGNVSAKKYIHKGKSFTLDGKLGSLDIELAQKGLFLTATDSCSVEAINFTFDEEFLEEFNYEGEGISDTDRILVEYSGSFDESNLTVNELNPLISSIVNDTENHRILLRKSLLRGVFVDGEKGNDMNSGLATHQPVQTIEKALKVLSENEDLDTIWILDKVKVAAGDTVNVNLSEKFIKRHPAYDGILLEVSGTLNLQNVTVDGMCEYMDGQPTGSLIIGEFGSHISIGNGAFLQNNVIMGDEAINSERLTAAQGGAIHSTGTVTLDGGTIQDCKAYMGGGIYMGNDGVFLMKSGTIQRCTAAGYMKNPTGGENDAPSAGGGVCIDGTARMEMNGGKISNCEAIIGAGVSLGGGYGMMEHISEEESLTMTGGLITENKAGRNGGGIYVQATHKATITGGEISYNDAVAGNFGGGGIYVNSNENYSEADKAYYKNGRLLLKNAIIRDNEAGSGGGGLAGCDTSNTEIYLNDGGAFYQNTGRDGRKDDILLSDSNGVSTIAAPNSFVSEYMLGGGSYFWKYVGSEKEFGVNYLHDSRRVKHMYTDAVDEDASVQEAIKKATVYIVGNTALKRGGGIGSNGDVILGTAPADTVTLSVKKRWDDEGYDDRRPDHVVVRLWRDGEKAACVEVEKSSDGKWPEVSFTQPAGHEYKISEDTGDLPGIYTSSVEVDAENPNKYIVTNHINCGRLYIHKAVEGVPSEPWTETFKFRVTLEDAKGEPVTGTYTVRKGTDADPFDETAQEVMFEDGTAEITLAAGQYAYIDDIPKKTKFTVTEQDTEGYIVYASKQEDPTVEKSFRSGTIRAKQTKSAYFKNVYSHDNEITVTKLVTNDKGSEYPLTRSFWVALFADEELTEQVTEPQELVFDSTSSASVTFEGLLNNKMYYVGELDKNGNVINDKPNYLSDGSAFTVQFGDGGNTVTAVHGTTSEISFRNEVAPKTVKRYQGIPVSKALTGRAADAAKDSYTFTLTGLDGAPVPDKTFAVLTLPDAAESTFEEMFGTIPFTEAGTFVYEIREQTGDIGGITYDETVYRITIQVESFDTIDNETVPIPNVIALEKSDNGKDFEPVQGGVDGTIVFTNAYTAYPVTFEARVSKTVVGDVPPDHQKKFTFTIEPKDAYTGVTMPGNRTCTVTGSGSGAFDAITFANPGTYAFTIKEIEGTDSGYDYDDTEYTLTVVVEDNTDGNLVVKSGTFRKAGSAETSGDTAAFINTYSTTSTSFAPTVRKVITGSPATDKKTFEFKLAYQSGNADGYEIANDTVTIEGEGTADFAPVSFTKAGTYVFTITETVGTEPGYAYDTSVYTVTVAVTDHESELKVDSVVYQAGDESNSEAAIFENRHLTGSLIVTKSLTYAGHPLHALKETFYVALYADKECKQRVSDVKALVYEDTVSAEVVFDGLEIGVPYYIGECDKEGTVLDSGALLDGTFFRTMFANGNEILLSTNKEQLRREFSNEFAHIPADYYYQGELTVTKHLQDEEGNPKNSNDIFYLGIFEDEAHTRLSDSVEPNILTLDMAGHSSATAMVYTRTPDEAGLKLYIAEVDANGVVIQDKEDFGYDLTMSSDAPLLTLDQSRVSVSVTNREKAEEPETESETEKYTETEGQTNTEPPQVPGSAKAVSTGDETALWLYLILLALSAGMIASVSVKACRKRKRD